MDRKLAKRAYQEQTQPMGIVVVRNLKDGRCYIERSKNTPATMRSLRFQLKNGAFASSHALCRDWKEQGEESFVIEVLDELAPVDDVAHDYDADLKALEALWLEKLQPYGDKGYHSRPPGART
jgi:hypothetical protein